MNDPKITIGVPIYNGERFIRKRLDSILFQTFSNFELIISDNASTDSSSNICQEYVKKDKRIKYFLQKKNINTWKNFEFVLNKASSKYFVWAAVDDSWKPEFLEKTINALESNKNLMGCLTKIQSYQFQNELQTSNVDSKFRNFSRSILGIFRSYDAYPFFGTYEEKVRKLLTTAGYMILYAVFRIDVVKKSWISESFVALDVAFALNVLKYGDFEVINEPLFHRYTEGHSTKGIINLASMYNNHFLGLIFPHNPLTSWCRKNLPRKIFVKNLDYFILLNIGSEIFLILDSIRLLIKRIKGKKY